MRLHYINFKANALKIKKKFCFWKIWGKSWYLWHTAPQHVPHCFHDLRYFTNI